MKPIFLASESPRRSELLARVGIPFEKVPRRKIAIKPRFDSNRPELFAIELAAQKAKSALPPEPGLVLGCDTIVVCENRLLEKPRSRESAFEYLTMLQGRSHTVFTGLAIWDSGSDRLGTDFEATEVLFGAMTSEEITAYIDTDEPMDKAGAYGIQEKGALLVREVRGDYFNVVGLPLFRLTVLLSKFNILRLEIISR